jgi:hypothetical protein
VRISATDITIDPDVPGTTATFSTCTIDNLAILSIPIPGLVPNTLSVHVRLSSPGNIIDETTSQVAYINGTLLITYALTSKINLQQPNIDINLFGAWQQSPSQWGIGNLESIKLNAFLDDYVQKVKESLDLRPLQKVLRSLDKELGCTIPGYMPMTCTAATRTIPESCHPCDFCCNCMVRQICDGDCSTCPCVNCSYAAPQIWFYTALFFICSLLIVFTFLYK